MAYTISFGDSADQVWCIKNTLIDWFFDQIFSGTENPLLRDFTTTSTFVNGIAWDFDYGDEEILKEVEIIKSYGYDHVLIRHSEL